ncbi:MAG: GNAT family N-acetyltransferase [Oscillospiraceae bacterium]|jgi:RimJ/RimL family protein N-acetyltransferase|nr:GNAT family N-acetyltransferase [Oscillospiraceae bacterium]
MKYFQKIIGENLFLSPISIEDAEQYTKWLNDPAVAIPLGHYKNMMSLSNEKKALEGLTTEGHNYAIILKDAERLIGNIGFFDINHISRRATIGLFIGEAEMRGKGYGTEAIRLLLKFGFDTLNLHNIMLQCDSDNKQGIACYKKVGFQEFGRRRSSTFKNGCYLDTVHMDILSTEF